ncbi:MAG: SMC-Scp complex subunit ScpB, partial [Calditrichaeota bacterium]
IIFAADNPVAASALSKYIEKTNGFDFDEVIRQLNEEYEQTGRSIQIIKVAGGYQMATRPEYAPWIKKMYMGRTLSKLTRASLEALAIIAFRQPISKAEVSAIRGVNSDGVIRNLLERKLITISGRGEGIGRPLLYSTTPQFLEYFGINDITDLPKPREIEELFGEGKYVDQIIEALSAEEQAEVTEDPSSESANSENNE